MTVIKFNVISVSQNKHKKHTGILLYNKHFDQQVWLKIPYTPDEDIKAGWEVTLEL